MIYVFLQNLLFLTRMMQIELKQLLKIEMTKNSKTYKIYTINGYV